MPTSTRRDALLFTGISGKFGTAQGGRQSRRPLQKVFDPPYSVGADDSVRPAECTVFLQKSSANSYAPRLPLGSRGAGPTGLRGFECRKFRKHSGICYLSPPSFSSKMSLPLTARGAARGGFAGHRRRPVNASPVLNLTLLTAGAGVPICLEHRPRFIFAPRCFRRRRASCPPAA